MIEIPMKKKRKFEEFGQRSTTLRVAQWSPEIIPWTWTRHLVSYLFLDLESMPGTYSWTWTRHLVPTYSWTGLAWFLVS